MGGKFGSGQRVRRESTARSARRLSPSWRWPRASPRRRRDPLGRPRCGRSAVAAQRDGDRDRRPDRESLRVMPNVNSLIGDKGAMFTNSFVNYSLCCPSRATFLTGQYEHNHGVTGNTGAHRRLPALPGAPREQQPGRLAPATPATTRR